ncbi:hypothetical protein Q1695_010301 [Nippostrongylus brasiliensis]|nr:hypothetical protein Q1695_010301 [Nippostrongylus brasiliensis]
MKLSAVQQLTLIAAVAAFLYAPVYAFKAVAPGDDKNDINGGWIVMKYEHFDPRNRRVLEVKDGEVFEMKVFKKPNMTHTDAYELCRRNNAILLRNGLVKTKIYLDNFPLEAVWWTNPWPICRNKRKYYPGMPPWEALDHCNTDLKRADYAICERPEPCGSDALRNVLRFNMDAGELHKCKLYLERAHPELFPDAAPDSLPYLFAFYTGIMRGSPWISPEAALPSLSAGVLFGLGMASFVVATDHLNASIAYPICAMAPGLVVSMWSILYFREITGKRNLIVLAVAYCFTLVEVTLMTVSREVVFP